MNEIPDLLPADSAVVRNTRRGLFLFISLSLTALGLWIFGFNAERTWLDQMQWVLFIILMAHISTGFTLALLGFFREISGGQDVLAPGQALEEGAVLPATAVLIPVYNEDMAAVCQRLRTMWKSLDKTGNHENFDFYFLSDSTKSEFWAGEVQSWMGLVRELRASGRIFYRRRFDNAAHKSGNIADFCHRWGKHYRYMLVLDADSMLTGKLMKQLVALMEQRPSAGIIQSVPQLVGGESVFRRSIQFAASLYGRIFVQGCAYWQMDGANYWGHNAIIRISAFMKYCALPELPPTGERQAHILSHDTIEAALMRKAGYGVWLYPNREGSYEESPPNLSDALTRDRRWCQGNFQHVWFLFAPGLDFSNRIHILFGLLAYLSSPLWLLFLILGVLSIGMRNVYPFAPPAEETAPLLLLFFFTMVLLFFPKILAAAGSFGRRRSYGGGVAFVGSLMVEILLSALLAPVIMLFHSLFVVQALAGWKAGWNAQNRAEGDLPWSSCFRTYGLVSFLGLVMTGLLVFFVPDSVPWLSPILLSWILAVPLARWTSLPGLGKNLREKGLFLVPEETDPPEELAFLQEDQSRDRPTEPGFNRILIDPLVLALHLSFLQQQQQNRTPAPPVDALLLRRCLEEGPASLEAAEKKRILEDAAALQELHESLWTRPGSLLEKGWARAFAGIYQTGGRSGFADA